MKNILTSREIEVAKLLAKGLSYKQIAEKLNISFFTTKAHVENIYRKMNVYNKVQLAIKFYKYESNN